MATDLEDLVPSLKREVAPPGAFSATYGTSTDIELVGYLSDAFAAAQLEGFFGSMTLTDGIVTPDLSLAGQAVVVIYAAERILTAQIMNMRQRVLYEAGPVKYETENSASVLAQILKSMAARKLAILDSILAASRGAVAIEMADAYSERVTGVEGALLLAGPNLTFYPYEIA